MLQRYDNRLAEFAQTLNDALNLTLPARITAAISGAPHDSTPTAIDAPDHSNVVRVLELAREQTAADAAVAIVGTNQRADPRDGRPLADGGRPGRRAGSPGLPRRARDPGLVQRRRRAAERQPDPRRPRDPAPRLGDRPGHARSAHPHSGSPLQRGGHHLARERPQHHAGRRSRRRSSCASPIRSPSAIRSPISTTGRHSMRCSTARSGAREDGASSSPCSCSTSTA